jgi:penicillin-binding protein 1B
VVALAVGAWWLRPFWQLSRRLSEVAGAQPTRLYGAPLVVRRGESMSAWRLGRELGALGYRESAGAPPPGTYRLGDDGGAIHLRATPTPRGWRPAGRLEVRLAGGRVTRLAWEGQAVEEAPLEAPVIATLYGPDRQERRPVRLEDLPEHLVQAVLAAEDATFFEHQGLSLRGIARAAWVNLRGGALQGGSTLTQQLVKNLFLSHERTISRKLREAVLALFVEARYSKRAILAAYLNEIYWGESDGANLMGVGAASWAYFGKQPEHLDLCEAALLAGMIRSPGSYSPARHPEAARERRDWVFDRMAKEEWLTEAEAAERKREKLCYAPQPLVAGRAPYFADLARAEAAERFGASSLQDGGYAVLTTLRLTDQRAADEAVARGLAQLEEAWERRSAAEGPIQAALVSLDPRSGAILAYVGGRDYASSQFDRASLARRQAGSAFKPVVYAAALASGTATPATLLEDAPLTVALADSVWSPENSDEEYRGWVTVRRALEESLNVPTARLALATGLPEVVDMARRLGVRGRLQTYPALALGAFEVTPVELATVYATLAASGRRPPVHAVVGILDDAGKPAAGRELERPARALDEATAFVVTAMLRGVLDRGTAASVRELGIGDPLAGKTGTTNERRDSWFAGYSPDRATLVWVGYDANARTRLTGSRGALPLWARFTAAVRPPRGFAPFVPPPGVRTATIDPETGQLATNACPTWATEYFLEGTVPEDVCFLHGGWFRRPTGDRLAAREMPPGAIVERGAQRRGVWRWLGKVLGGRRETPPPPPPAPPAEDEPPPR